jgi:hypothetical protein
MKSRQDLALLRRDYERQLNRFERLFIQIIRKPDPLKDTKSDINYLIIEMLNRHRNFNRALLFSSAKGARTMHKKTRTKVAGVGDEFDFIQAVFANYPSKQVNANARTWASRDEPAWEADVNRIAQALNLQNLTEIDSAFAISGFYKKLKIFRNFCAHRSTGLFREVANVALQENIVGDSTEELVTLQKPSGGYLVMDWITSSRNYADQICE